ncbi:MAG: hypothetical protein M1814_001937 [Vezdaea aestivalis]|nr:MAG: hypothetical protein M1814_001937 [Vezdaea aestivalis]
MSIPLPTSTSFPKPGMPATPTTALATSYSSSPTTIIQIVQTDTTASFLTILLFLALLCLVLFQLLKNNPFNQASVDQSQARPQITQPTEAAALSAIELPAEPAEVSGIPSSQSIVCEITNGIQRGRIQFEMGSATSMGSRSRSMTESDHQDMATETWVHDLRPSEKIQERSKDGDVTVTINERRTSLVFD